MTMTLESYTYEPGNATRYDLLYGETPNGGYLLVWLHKSGSGGSAFRFSGDCFVAAGYLAEKMSIPAHLGGDTNALLAFLRLRGHHAEVSGFFDKAGNYVYPDTTTNAQRTTP
jgi:hypothetical protein